MNGIMKQPSSKPEGELLQSLRSAFGPTTGTARTLEERLQSLTEQAAANSYAYSSDGEDGLFV
jgi:hypothetical protein